MHGNEGLSPTHEMYLKVLYRLQLQNEVGRVRDMAKGLGVTAGTVSAVLKRLDRDGLVIHDHYGSVKLTPAGLRVAECVVRRFEIIKAMLVDVLGMEVETAELDACMMEHAVSPATINRLELLTKLVRAGTISIDPMRRQRPPLSVCSDCESVRSCQAVSSMEEAEARNLQN